MQTRIYITRLSIIISGILFLYTSAKAQEPSKKQTIEITSSFKPTLKDAAKINFNAAPPVPDSARPKFKYTIPVNSLALAYQPAAVTPAALHIDSTGSWSATNFIKLGYGNFQTPYAQAGLTLDNKPNSSLNILGHYISSKGSAVPRQQYADAGASAYGSTINANNQELYGKLGLSNKAYYLYGYDQTAYTHSKNELLQRFLGIDANIGFRNIDPTGFGLLYHPDIKVSFFNDNHSNREFNVVGDVPLEKKISDELSIKLGINADYTQFSPKSSPSINNFIFTVPIAIKFKNESLSIHGGAIPSWDNSNFKLLPDLMADVKLSGEEAILQFGWLMHYDKGSYQRWASLNPYLALPTTLFNTRINETYGGLRGTFLEKFFYNAKVGLVQFYNMPLFVNDYATNILNDGKTFVALKEDKLNAFQIHGEAGVVQAEDFSLSAKFNWLMFGKQKTQQQPWGIIPRELSAALRWKILKDLWFKSDLFFFEGAKYMNRSLGSETARSPVDLNAGLEFRVTKQFNLWLQANNIFNNTYQRWNQYEIYGFNIMGGIVFNFDSFTKPLTKQ
ncbi:hypothetical protein [Terrimonas sp.]|uniref:hypothetical protein n=1 Tax=Terrimonas sp. TaxID=1914338 RepID=UPI001056FB88|nr:hypothetical protein [Terrimonas sp.]